MRIALFVIVLALAGSPATAQVAINPLTTTPAAWERFSVRVINQTDTPTVAVRVEVPGAMLVIGVERKPGWTVETTQAPDSAPTIITWRGGTITKGEYGEFPFLARLKATAKQGDMVFPVGIERASGSTVEWRKDAGMDYAAPRVEITGTVRVGDSGKMALAGAAVGISILALVIAIAMGAKRRT